MFLLAGGTDSIAAVIVILLADYFRASGNYVQFHAAFFKKDSLALVNRGLNSPLTEDCVFNSSSYNRVSGFLSR